MPKDKKTTQDAENLLFEINRSISTQGADMNGQELFFQLCGELRGFMGKARKNQLCKAGCKTYQELEEWKQTYCFEFVDKRESVNGSCLPRQ